MYKAHVRTNNPKVIKKQETFLLFYSIQGSKKAEKVLKRIDQIYKTNNYK